MSDILERLREAASGGDVFVSPGQAADEIQKLQNRIAELEAALRSIASNTCCDKCQEAALVARAALEGGKS